MNNLTQTLGNGVLNDDEIVEMFNKLQLIDKLKNNENKALYSAIKKGLSVVKKQTQTNLRNYTGIRSREMEQGILTKVYDPKKSIYHAGGVISITGSKGKGLLLRIFNNNKKQQRKGGWSNKSQPRFGSYKRKYSYSDLNRGIIKGKPYFFNDALAQKEQEVFGNLRTYLVDSINKINKKQKIGK